MLLQQSEATAAQRRLLIYLVDATNGYTPETGLSSGFTIEVSKNGAAQASGSGSITEIGEGNYYYEATSGELDTLGFLNISIRHASCRDFVAMAQIVPWDPYFDFVTNISDIETDTNEIQGKLPTDNIMGSSVLTAKDDEIDQIITDIAALNNITAAAVWAVGTKEITGGALTTPNDYKATGFSTHAAADIWSVVTRALTDKAGFTISGTTQTFDALDTLLDSAHGAGSWLSATGFSTHAAADIWTAGSRALSTPNDYKATGFSTHTAADIWTVGTRALTDKAGFTISGTLQTLDALENISTTQVNTEVEQALIDIDLDHLIQVAAGVETPTVDSYLDQIMNKAGTQDFDPTTDSLEAIRDRGDAEWDTATGFSTHAAADIWTAGSRALSTPNDYKATGFSTHSAVNVWAVGTRDITGGTVDAATSVTNDVGITQAGADKVWSTAARSLTDKAGFTISGTTQTFDALDTLLDAAHGAGSWLTGGGGSGIVIQVIPSIPNNIDVSNTKLIRLALYVIDASDDLPTTAEITPGTITIDRSADGGTSWSNVVNAAACSEHAGCIYYDEVFDSGTGYASADMIRITFKGQKVTISGNDFEIADATDGMIFTIRMDSGLSGGGPSAGDIADAVWDEPIVDHTNSAQFGGKNQKVVPSETIADYKATGFSTHAAADIWSVGTRALTDKAGFTISGTTQTFDALDTLLDSAHGAGSWLSAVGYSTHVAADIWTAASRALSTPNDYKATGFSTHNAAAIWSEATKEITGGVLTTPNDYKADVSGLATSSALSTHDGKLDTVDGIVDTILIDTGTTLPAEVLRLRGLNGEFIIAEYTFVGDDNTVTEYWQYDNLSNFNTHNKSTGLIGSWILNNTFVSSKPTIIKSKRLT